MNERIRELAEQAFREAALYGGKRGDKEFDTRYNQKFAELIVGECAGLCVSNLADEICGGKGFSDKIKQHFGVEE